MACRSIEAKSLRVKQQPKEKGTYRDRYEAQRIEDMKQVISQGLSIEDTASLIKSLYETVAPSRHWKPVANPEFISIHEDVGRQFRRLWHQAHPPSQPAPPPPQTPPPPTVEFAGLLHEAAAQEEAIAQEPPPPHEWTMEAF